MSDTVIDEATFGNLTDLVGEDFIGELVATFFEEAPELLAEMTRALDSGDSDAFRRAAHSLKSNGESFGATELAAQARELEYLGRDGRLDEARPKVARLGSLYEETVQALRGLL